MKKNQHVMPRGGMWVVKGEGNTRATRVFATQQEAIETAREISRNQKSELLVHNRKGEISRRDSHGNDPRYIKG